MLLFKLYLLKQYLGGANKVGSIMLSGSLAPIENPFQVVSCGDVEVV